MEYVVDGSAVKSLKLRNDTGRDARITRVWIKPLVPRGWGEYCVSIRDWITGQKEPGFGEVACVHKDTSDSQFAPLEWNEASIPLALASGLQLYVAGYVKAGSGQDHRKTIYVTTSDGSGGARSLRQPRDDTPIRCSGAAQTTAWSPWKNVTGREVKISGAKIYAVDPYKRDSVDAACIHTLDSTGMQVKWRYCTKVNARGGVNFPPVAVGPGEHIGGQAKNTCERGGLWDWAAYIETTD